METAGVKNKILNLGIFILALIIAYQIYKVQNRTLESTKQDKESEINKNTVLSKIAQFEKDLNLYKRSLGKKDTSLIISTLSNIAKDSGIEIVSLMPNPEQAYPEYIKYPFKLTVRADNYHVLGRFVSKVESHADVYIVESVEIRAVAQLKKEKLVDVVLEISSVSFKD